jgi:hypothetical protein
MLDQVGVGPSLARIVDDLARAQQGLDMLDRISVLGPAAEHSAERGLVVVAPIADRGIVPPSEHGENTAEQGDEDQTRSDRES